LLAEGGAETALAKEEAETVNEATISSHASKVKVDEAIVTDTKDRQLEESQVNPQETTQAHHTKCETQKGSHKRRGLSQQGKVTCCKSVNFRNLSLPGRWVVHSLDL
jgi:hypothetical protein